jgi:hypothetical protein
MNEITNQPAGFAQKMVAALARLKQQLRGGYEKADPQLREIIHLVLEEEESRAWELTSFPHLLLPDLVEARVAQFKLRPVETKQADVSARRDGAAIKTVQPAVAVCG